MIFALIWWLIAFTHGDLEPDHLPSNQTESNWMPCVLNIHGFTSCFLFSIETQHTIGYGVRTTTEECPEAVFIMCLQSIAGMIIQAFMVRIQIFWFTCFLSIFVLFRLELFLQKWHVPNSGRKPCNSRSTQWFVNATVNFASCFAWETCAKVILSELVSGLNL